MAHGEKLPFLRARLTHGEWPDTLKNQPYLPDPLRPYWDAFIELRNMTSGEITIDNVRSWLDEQGITGGESRGDYVYFVSGLDACRKRLEAKR